MKITEEDEKLITEKDEKIIDDFIKRAKERDLKITYNQTLKRYYNGCNYISEHLEEVDEYLPVILKLKNILDKISNKILIATEEEILNGFKT